jgi:hypothetical protein
MRRSSLRLLFATLFLSAAAGLLGGCSSAPRASVSGKVTLQGAPLKNKVVLTFVGADNVPHSTQTDETGTYCLTGLPIGAARVTLVSIPDGGPAPRAFKSQDQTPAGARQGYAPQPPPEVPLEYGDAGNPKLTFNLVEGDNDLPINLVASPPARRNEAIIP